MVDKIDADGLSVKSLSEIKTSLENGMKGIFGSDINIEQNSPDGQLINIFAQAAVDIRELAVSINSGFDPNQASGRVLDERVTLNNIIRKAGTYTIQPISITVDRNVYLSGLDADFNNPDGAGYTIQDSAGNRFILIDSVTLVAGTTSKNFRAENIGQTLTTINTITTPVTSVLGVTAINNPSSAITIGEDEETDAALRLRRERSVAINSSGYLNGLNGLLLSIDGVTDVKIHENPTGSVDSNSIPAHGVWVVIDGGANSDIANAIYQKKSYGCALKGSVSVNIDTESGEVFIAKFDRPTAENIYIRFDIQPVLSGAVFDQALIKNSVIDSLSFNIGEYSETSSLTAIALASINENGGGGVPVNMEISKNGTNWFDYLIPSTPDKQFVADVSRITITEL
ncbi:MAG: baseplate J/gp47 family protein [Rickettsiales bacterium]